jgi:hypothetical protein
MDYSDKLPLKACGEGRNATGNTGAEMQLGLPPSFLLFVVLLMKLYY